VATDNEKGASNPRRHPSNAFRPVGEDGEASVGDLIPDKMAEDPAEKTGYLMLKSRLRGVLSTLTESDTTSLSDIRLSSSPSSTRE